MYVKCAMRKLGATSPHASGCACMQGPTVRIGGETMARWRRELLRRRLLREQSLAAFEAAIPLADIFRSLDLAGGEMPPR